MIQYFVQNIKKYILLLFNPSYFPHGSDVSKSYPLNNYVFYKKFKKKSKNSFLKTIYLLKEFEMNHYHFTPTVFYYNSKLELYTSHCGNLLQIKNLPNNWENQLINIKNICIRHNICIKDWGLWEINPFICNNLTLKNGNIYFIDMGNAIKSDKKYIDYYFQKKIRSIKLIIKYGYFYLFFHYLNRFRIEIILLHPLIKLMLEILLFYYIYIYF